MEKEITDDIIKEIEEYLVYPNLVIPSYKNMTVEEQQRLLKDLRDLFNSENK